MGFEITEKQIGMIRYLLENNYKSLFEKLPRNNAQFDDLRANWRRMILEQRLERLDRQEASYIINIMLQPTDQSAKVELFLRNKDIL